jgi:hypothetical protein
VPEYFYLDFAICIGLSLTCWMGVFHFRHALKSQWIEMVAIALVSGFLAFIVFLLLKGMGPRFGLPATRWLTVPAVLATVWFFHGMLSRKS